MNQIDYYIKVKKNDVNFVCAFLEAFEGMTSIRTPNPKPGEDNVMHMMVSPDFKEQFEILIDKLGEEIQMERVEP
jgi:hypothetical protein